MDKQRVTDPLDVRINKSVTQQLIDCATACEECVALCLNDENVNRMTLCIELSRDCADTCFLTEKLLSRSSPIAGSLLVICEEICRLCATECRKHDSKHCQVCADACDRCADACHEFQQQNSIRLMSYFYRQL
jgi:hypothetical protein